MRLRSKQVCPLEVSDSFLSKILVFCGSSCILATFTTLKTSIIFSSSLDTWRRLYWRKQRSEYWKIIRISSKNGRMVEFACKLLSLEVGGSITHMKRILLSRFVDFIINWWSQEIDRSMTLIKRILLSKSFTFTINWFTNLMIDDHKKLADQWLKSTEYFYLNLLLSL